MAITSDWPLPAQGVRFLTPQRVAQQLAAHPLSEALYPLAMGYYPRAAGHRMSREHHDSYLLMYCIDGAGSLHCGDRHYPIGSGDVILLPRGLAHRYAADHKQPWTLYWLHFDGRLAAEFSQHCGFNTPCAHIGVQPRIVRIFDGLSELRRSAYQLSEFIQGGHQLQALLSYLALLLHQQQASGGKNLDWERIRALMQEHIHSQLNLDTLAASANVSKFHFIKKFKAWSGQSPIQYFIHMKVQRACYLLDSTAMSVKEVAAALGYDDVYYFSRLFKKVLGIAPSAYRHHRGTLPAGEAKAAVSKTAHRPAH